MLLIIFAAVICLAVLNFNTVIGFIKSFIGMLKPFIVGGAIAFVVNLPMKFIEEKWLNRLPAKLQGCKRTLGILLSLLFFVAVIAFVVISVIPLLQVTFATLSS